MMWRCTPRRVQEAIERQHAPLDSLGQAGQYWVYEYLFAKKDRDNIDDDELAAFRSLAKGYAGLTELQIDQLAGSRHFVEICYDDKA